MKNVKDLIDQLPPEYQRELEDFAEFLVQRAKTKRQKGELKLEWRGELRKEKDEYTSVVPVPWCGVLDYEAIGRSIGFPPNPRS